MEQGNSSEYKIKPSAPMMTFAWENQVIIPFHLPSSTSASNTTETFKLPPECVDFCELLPNRVPYEIQQLPVYSFRPKEFNKVQSVSKKVPEIHIDLEEIPTILEMRNGGIGYSTADKVAAEAIHHFLTSYQTMKSCDEWCDDDEIPIEVLEDEKGLKSVVKKVKKVVRKNRKRKKQAKDLETSLETGQGPWMDMEVMMGGGAAAADAWGNAIKWENNQELKGDKFGMKEIDSRGKGKLQRQDTVIEIDGVNDSVFCGSSLACVIC